MMPIISWFLNKNSLLSPKTDRGGAGEGAGGVDVHGAAVQKERPPTDPRQHQSLS